jgi:hypothetical protein
MSRPGSQVKKRSSQVRAGQSSQETQQPSEGRAVKQDRAFKLKNAAAKSGPSSQVRSGNAAARSGPGSRFIESQGTPEPLFVKYTSAKKSLIPDFLDLLINGFFPYPSLFLFLLFTVIFGI